MEKGRKEKVLAMRCAGITAFLLAAACGCGLSAAGQAANSAAATPAEEGAGERAAPQLQALVARLGNASIATRDQAQQNLEEVSAWDRAELQQLANASGDPEIEARAMIRLREMNDVLLLNHQPMPLNFRGGLSVAAQEIAKAGGVPVSADTAGDPDKPAEMYSLDGGNLAFCEVISRLSQEHPLALDAGRTRITLTPAGSARTPLIISKGAVVCLGELTMHSPPVPFGQHPSPVIDVPISVQIDPRVALTDARNMNLKVVNHETGATLVNSAGARGPAYAGKNGGASLTQSIPLPNRGDLHSLEISGGLLLTINASDQAHKEIDPATQLHVPISYGGAAITVAELSMDPAQPGADGPAAVLAFQIQGHDGQLPAQDIPKDFGFAGSIMGNDGSPRQQIDLTVIDAQGRKLHVSHETSDSSGSERDHIPGPMTAPLKILLSSPSSLRSVAIPFEFRNVPVTEMPARSQ